MQGRGCAPDVTTWNSAISACEKSGRWAPLPGAVAHRILLGFRTGVLRQVHRLPFQPSPPIHHVRTLGSVAERRRKQSRVRLPHRNFVWSTDFVVNTPYANLQSTSAIAPTRNRLPFVGVLHSSSSFETFDATPINATLF